MELLVGIPPGAWMPVSGVVCCQVDVSSMDRSIAQGSPTECSVSGCDLETTSAMKRTWPMRAVEPVWGGS
jgi:hypothetical protein